MLVSWYGELECREGLYLGPGSGRAFKRLAGRWAYNRLGFYGGGGGATSGRSRYLLPITWTKFRLHGISSNHPGRAQIIFSSQTTHSGKFSQFFCAETQTPPNILVIIYFRGKLTYIQTYTLMYSSPGGLIRHRQILIIVIILCTSLVVWWIEM